MGQKYKYFNFAIEYKMYGTKSVKVPADFTQEQAEEYVLTHWDDINLPSNANYLADSAVADFKGSDFGVIFEEE